MKTKLQLITKVPTQTAALRKNREVLRSIFKKLVLLMKIAAAINAKIQKKKFNSAALSLTYLSMKKRTIFKTMKVKIRRLFFRMIFFIVRCFFEKTQNQTVYCISI